MPYKSPSTVKAAIGAGVREANRGDSELVQRLIVKEGSLAGAARQLNLAESTLRSQLSSLPCPGCGSAHDPRAARCRSCEAARRRGWSNHDLLDARESWRGLYGDAPTSYDWNPTLGPRFHGGLGPRRHEGRWPPAATVLRRFGSWPDFLSANLADYPPA